MRVAIIPARGGSKRIPRKNIRLFHGKPIIEYSIEAALRSKLFDHVIVSTEDMEIAEVSQTLGASIWKRDPRFADDITGTQAVAKELLSGSSYDVACVIYSTAPLISVDDLYAGHWVMQLPETNFAFSVGTKPVLHDAGQFYWGKSKVFVEDFPLWDSWSRMVPISPGRDCDINTEEDWKRAEKMYALLHS